MVSGSTVGRMSGSYKLFGGVMEVKGWDIIIVWRSLECRVTGV